MRKGLIISGILHIILLGAILINFTSSSSRKLEVSQPVAVPVEFATPSDISESKQGKKDGKSDEPSLPKPPDNKKVQEGRAHEQPKMNDKQAAKTVAAAPPPPEQKKAEAAAPEPPPKPEPEKKPEVAEVKPEKKPEPPKPKKVEKPKPKPEVKPAATPAPPDKNRTFDPNRISALLNRDPNAGSVAPSEHEKRGRPPSSLQDQAAGVASGTGARMLANEIDAFRGQIQRCWSPPVGGLGGDSIEVKLRIQMSQDGSVAGTPQIMNSQNSPFFLAAADAAIRAVLQCQPYAMPAEKYDQWRDMILKFDPSQM